MSEGTSSVLLTAKVEAPKLSHLLAVLCLPRETSLKVVAAVSQQENQASKGGTITRYCLANCDGPQEKKIENVKHLVGIESLISLIYE